MPKLTPSAMDSGDTKSIQQNNKTTKQQNKKTKKQKNKKTKKGVLFYQYPSIRFIAIQLKLMLPAQSLKTFPYGYTNQQSIAMLYTIPALILRLS
ncbi:hypothetical protein ACILPN_21640 [Yersinia wautersii]|uniref:hypothetical protein n=1 Tax=Yersinia pseudotuberculosis TaxID=633 RepID=UPI000E0E7AAF|nr:hypothetical protein [Yersinia pseudotuberculosis]